MSNDKQVPKTPARGRKKNGSLEELDTQFQEASTDRTAQELEANQASTSKRSAAEKTSEETVEKRSKRVIRHESPERHSSDSEESSDSDKSSDTSSNSDSSSDESSKRTTKAKGFILFRNNPLVTVGNRGSLRKMARLMKAQASLMDDVDRKGKDAFVENYDEVRENLTFIRELIRSIKQDFPDHKLKKPTLVNLGKLKDCLKGLVSVIDPSENAPQWGLHLLDWTESSELRKALGKAAARKIRTAVKGQKRQHKVLFTKSPHSVSQTWKSKQNRGHSNASSSNHRGNFDTSNNRGNAQNRPRQQQGKHPFAKKKN